MRRILCLIACLIAAPAAAQIRSLEVRTPRPFGHFLGDLVQVTVEIEAEPGFALQSASLPTPGPVTYWLDLRAVEPETVGTRHRLRLTYQNFYAAIDARSLEVPGFPLVLASDGPHGATTASAQVPGWNLGVSPLREVQPPRRADPAEYLRPDGRGPRLRPEPMRDASLALAVLAVAALGLLARDRAWWPFHARPARAFARPARRLAALARGPQTDEAYREGLMALHRGLDAAAGQRLLADDLPTFLARHAAYRGQGEGLGRFFAASRLAFFGGAAEAARTRLPLAEVSATARRLAEAERAA
ncbi:nonribosomal peptide synthetase MxaA [Methylobacterium durans]|uniref:nonribosomal peptide synthetase MxaA n=1 Tax=Methylobacterium durans TaxID=2202825 RepID=UPI002AFF7FD2|nr:nonribosomal peptide synthetase MxaA [Methylobacterium durans]MEA1834408.1 nonribosomal peptide synthetase MxaA [Methylobacterium durans]